MSETRSAEVVDVVWELAGETLARDYRAALWEALCGAFPWLRDEALAALHPIKAPVTEQAKLLLPRRARLTLRVPAARAGDIMQDGEHALEVAGDTLRISHPRVKPVEPFPTVSAWFVATDAPGELEHHAAVARMLEALGLPDRVIFGRMQTVRIGEAVATGSSVVLHQLRDAQSLLLQELGLGGGRHYGFGLFRPHKVISGLD